MSPEGKKIAEEYAKEWPKKAVSSAHKGEPHTERRTLSRRVAPGWQGMSALMDTLAQMCP